MNQILNWFPVMVIARKTGLNHKKPVQTGSKQFELQFSCNQFRPAKTGLHAAFGY
jgi:hypothetical protein